MANRVRTDFSEFANDLYDLMGKNGISQDDFFDRYVAEDRAFMIDEYKDQVRIYFDDFEIIIKPQR